MWASDSAESQQTGSNILQCSLLLGSPAAQRLGSRVFLLQIFNPVESQSRWKLQQQQVPQ